MMIPWGISKCTARATRKAVLTCPNPGRPFSRKNVEREGPAFAVRDKIMQGQINSDFKQTPVVNALQEVYENVNNYSPGKFFFSRPPRGLYIYGSVGAGKTMLMDIFYSTLKMKAKKRIHFNDFMADVHSRIHKLKGKAKGVRHEKPAISDPIAPVARDLVREAWLLCFDEFQVTDIADAMILKRLFTEMFYNGMVMVATSNRNPDDLYKNGLQRSQFLPFIPILKQYCKVVSVSAKDYRTEHSEGQKNYYLLARNSNTKTQIETIYNELCRIENQLPGPRTINILGHKIVFNNTCGRVLYGYFKDFCDKPLSSTDYIEIAKLFDTIIIKDIPKMNMTSRNQAKRFILLIDTLYEYKVRIMVSAAAPPRELFAVETVQRDLGDHDRMTIDDLQLEKNPKMAQTSLFSGSEEIFAFERTISRLNEMCSEKYWTMYDRGRK